MSRDKTHFLTLDGYRGIAAVAVVIFHVTPFYPKWMRSIDTSGYLAVDLFFLLSGVVVARSYGTKLAMRMTFSEFAKIRLLRLYPLYLLGSAIGLVTALLTPGSVDIPKAVLLALFYLPWLGAVSFFPLNEPAWSLAMELLSNVWYAFYCKVTNSVWLRNAVLAAALAGILLSLHIGVSLNIGAGANTWHHLHMGLIGGLARVMWSFVIGAVLWSTVQSDARRVSNIMTSVLVIAVLAVLARHPAHIRISDLVTVTAVFPVLVWAGIRYSPTGRTAGVCKFLGRISYPVYCIHLPLAMLLIRLGYHPNVFVFTAAVLMLAWTCDVTYDVPLRRMLGQWHTIRSYTASVKSA